MSVFDAQAPGSGGWVEIPVVGSAPVGAFIRRGLGEGPRTVVTASIHGDEFEGPAAVLDLVEDLRSVELRGDLVLIPVANPGAFAAASRASPEDGKNLARTFPGEPLGSATDRLAAALFAALAGADHLVDLHSGGVACEFWPLAGFHGPAGPANPSYLAASKMGLPGLWRLPPTPGVLSHELSARGVVAVGCEYRGGAGSTRRGGGRTGPASSSSSAIGDTSPRGTKSLAISRPPSKETGPWPGRTASPRAR